MKKILFPTDFSPAAANAFEYAQKLAAELGATIDVMNVFHLPFVDASNVPTDYIDQLLVERETEARRRLKDFVAGADEKLIGQTIADYGLFIPQEITDKAKAGAYDLIVMGTKGERSALEKLMGSVTTQTMMNAPCPVIAVPAQARYTGIGRIAYATDFHPRDEHAVAQLMKLAGRLGAEVNFVHVETKPDLGKMEDHIVVKNYPFEFTEFSVINAKSVLEGLDQYIQQKDVDMLALFIPRRRLWERLFHQSFTKEMTFHTSIPLLVFHE